MAGEAEFGLLAELGLEQDIGADHHEDEQDDRVERGARDARRDDAPATEPTKASAIIGRNVRGSGFTRR